jgi:hypothetical protein
MLSGEPANTKFVVSGSTRPGLSTIKIQLSVYVYYKVDIIIISLNVAFSRHDVA